MHIPMQGYPCTQNQGRTLQTYQKQRRGQTQDHVTGDDRKGSLHPLEMLKTICLHLDSVSSKVAVNRGRRLEKKPTIIIYLKCLRL